MTDLNGTPSARGGGVGWRLDAPSLAVAYAIALWLRLVLWDTNAYFVESGHYFASRHTISHATNLVSVTFMGHFDMAWQFWQRPIFSLALTPGALVSFDAYRLQLILMTSALAPLAILLLREFGARRATAYFVGLVVAVHPVLVNWGAYGMPDSLMVFWFVLAVLAERRGRPAWAGAFALAAVWTKEIAVFPILFLLGRSLWVGVRQGTTRLWPFQGDRLQTAYLGVLVLAPLPLLYALRLGAPFPGLRSGGQSWDVVDQVFMLTWFAPVLVAGLFHRKSRPLASLALVFPAFFLAYQFIMGRAVEIWYYMSPAYFSLIGTAFVLDTAWTLVRTGPFPRRVGWTSLTGALVVLLGLQIVGPVGDPVRDGAVTPLSEAAAFNLKWVFDLNDYRDDDLFAAFEALPKDPRPNVLLLDIHSNWGLYPLSERTQMTYIDDTRVKVYFNESIDRLVRTFESQAQWTILEKQDNVLSRAIQTTYADCLRFSAGNVAVYEGPACAGRYNQVEAKYREGQRAA